MILNTVYATIIFIIAMLFFFITYRYLPMREYVENALVYHPTRCVSYTKTPHDYGMQYKQFWIPGSKLDICTWLISHAQPARRLIIYCHGNAGNMQDFLEFIFQLSSNINDVDFLMFDYAGYGMTAGDCHESDMYESLLDVINFATKFWTPNHVMLYGHSLGAAVALHAAVKLRHITFAGLVLEAPFYSLKDIAADISPLANFWNFCNKYENYAKIQMISENGTPFLLVHSRNDNLIDINHSERLHNLVYQHANYRGLVYIDGDHIDTIYTDEYFDKLKELLAETPSCTEV
jgi:uncharacterized protein